MKTLLTKTLPILPRSEKGSTHFSEEPEVDERNQQLASFETVKTFHILPRDFSLEEGELTPTGKLRRKLVTERYKKELDSLY